MTSRHVLLQAQLTVLIIQAVRQQHPYETQTALAPRLGLPRQELQLLLKGRGQFSVERLIRILRTLGHDFLDLDGDDKIAAALKERPSRLRFHERVLAASV